MPCTAPELTVVKFKVEQGFAANGNPNTLTILLGLGRTPYSTNSNQENWNYDDQNTFGNEW